MTFTVKKISDWTASLSFMVNQFHKSCKKWYILAQVLIVLSGKSQRRIFCKYAHVHSMSLLTTEFHEILLSRLKELRLHHWLIQRGAEGTFAPPKKKRGGEKQRERERKKRENKKGFSLCILAFHSNLQECLFLHQTFHRRERLSIHHIWDNNNYSTLRSHWSFSSVCLIMYSREKQILLQWLHCRITPVNLSPVD